MSRHIASIVVASVLVSFTCICEALARDESPNRPFLEMNQLFVKNYGAVAAYNQRHARPAVVINGFQYNLLKGDGTTDSFVGAISRFAELKGTAHLGPCMFAIAKWRRKTLLCLA